MWFFKKRKSRKQLIAEIEELQGMLERYVARYHEKDTALDCVTKNIQTINVSCISRSDDLEIAKESLCNLLAKAMSPYITIESYQMVGEPWYGEWKHCALIQILEQKE